VYYLKATFGPRTADAMLEIPVSVTSNDKYLKVDYQISSPKIELVILQFSADNKSVPGDVKKYMYGDQHGGGGWSSLNFLLASDVARIQLVAKKIGFATNVEYVLVGVVEVIENPGTGNMPLMYCRSTMFVVGKHHLGAVLL